MLPSLLAVSLVLTCGSSDAGQSSPEPADTNATDGRHASRFSSGSGSGVKYRVTRSDVRATLGNKLDPGFWPARGRRNNAEDTPPHFGTNRWRPLRQPSQGLWPYWRPGALREDKGRLRLERPLYVEQPRYILLDRRYDPDESTDTSEPLTNPTDPFWVTRGRRQHDPTSASFWASMPGLNEKPHREGTSLESEFGFRGLAEEPLWSTRAGRSSFNFLDGSRSVSAKGPCWPHRGRRSASEEPRDRRGFLQTLPAEEPFWAARGKKSMLQDVDGTRLKELLSAVESAWSATDAESLPADEPVWAALVQTSTLGPVEDSRSKRDDEPYWAARARRNDDESEAKRGTSSSLLESLSAEEPFWAARGRRRFLESLSAEEPFWAARGKKESPRMTSPSPDDFLSQIRTRELSSKSDPWWPVRGKRVADTDTNPEDERFWRALESRTRNNTLQQSHQAT